MAYLHGQDIGFHVEYVNPSGDVTVKTALFHEDD